MLRHPMCGIWVHRLQGRGKLHGCILHVSDFHPMCMPTLKLRRQLTEFELLPCVTKENRDSATRCLPPTLNAAYHLQRLSFQAKSIITTSSLTRFLSNSSSEMAVSYVPTAEMPLMKGVRAALVQAVLDEKKSLFEVTLMLGDVVKDLEKDTLGKNVAIKKTVESFNEEVPLMHMASLLHYMNAKLLRSVIAGTLAYDLCQDRDLDKNCQYNDNATAGTYVVSLSIKGRQGRFLNIQELRKLTNLVKQYTQSAEIWNKNGKVWDKHNFQHLQAMRFIEGVDSKAAQADPDGQPQFGPNGAAIDKLWELASMFGRRVIVGLDVQNQGQTCQIQAPVMVGCTSETIAKWAKAHYPQLTEANPLVPAASSLRSTTKTWALTLSLLHYMDLEPVIVHVAALPFFNPTYLPRTEILLTTLARSLVWQDGFNVTEGGGQSDKNYALRGYEKKNVCYERDFLKNNLAATLQRIQEVRNKIAIIKNLDKVDLDALETEINKLKAKENSSSWR